MNRLVLIPASFWIRHARRIALAPVSSVAVQPSEVRMSLSLLFADAPVIHAYSRAQALADGALVDVSELARDAGFAAPVAVTAAVWADCVAWDQTREVAPQDETGRLWDVLAMAHLAARGQPDADRVSFSVLRIGSGRLRPSRVTLTLVIGPGDQREPVMTIMQPEED
jgi:hypothetical protein